MADDSYKGRSIQYYSYQEEGQWLPMAVVFTKSPRGTKTHSITSQTSYPTELEADAEAERLAKEWIDGQQA